MKNKLRGCQPQSKMTVYQLIVDTVKNKDVHVPTTKEINTVDKTLLEVWNKHEEKIMFLFIEKMNCEIKQIPSAKGAAYILSGKDYLVEIVQNLLIEIHDTLTCELKGEWKHYRNLDESEQLAYADMIMIDADKEYIYTRYIYNLLNRLEKYFDGRKDTDDLKTN